jgi:DNA-binding MarR family transcriptional regulator
MFDKYLDEVIHQPARTKIMTYLVVHRSVDFNTLKSELQMTDGQIANQIKTLEKAGYVKVIKEIIQKKTKTTYFLTFDGEFAFETYIDSLEKLIKIQMSSNPKNISSESNQ